MLEIVKSLTGTQRQQFETFNEFQNWYNKKCKNKNFDWFETFKDNQLTKIYLDYDADMKGEVSMDDIKEHYNKCKKELDRMNDFFEYKFPDENIEVAIACRSGNGHYKKMSGKKVLKEGYKVSLRFFFNICMNYQNIPTMLDEMNITIFDTSPYKKTQKLNMIGCTKASYDTRVLLPFDGERLCGVDEYPLSGFIAGYTKDCIIYDYKPTPKTTANTTQKPKANIIQDDDIVFNQVKAIIENCLTEARATDYSTWSLTLWSIINTFRHDEDKCNYLCHLFSKKSYKYDESGVDKFINDNINKEHSTPRTLASLYYDARTDNREEFKKIMEKFKLVKLEDFTHTGVARMIYKLKPEDFVWINKDLYTFNGRYWEKDPHHLRTYINNELTEMLRQLQSTFEPRTDEYKQIIKGINKLENEPFKRGVIDSTRDFFRHPDVKFDNQPHLFAFENCVYDLMKKEFRDFRKNDYLTITAGFDYRSPTEEERQHFQKIWDSIVPPENTDLNNCLTHIYTTGLWGRVLEKFVLMNGCGRNGKGLLNGMIKCVLGNYYADGNNEILTSKIKTGGNPEIANLEGKRLVICREPDENVPLNNSTIKELTGDSTIKARKCYSNEDNVNFVGTLLLECNNKPPFSGDTGVAETERIIDLLLPHIFTTDKDMIDNKKIFLANPSYKTRENYEKCKYAFLDKLIQFNKQFENYDLFNLQVPESIRNRSIDYISSSNDVAEWLLNNYEKTGKKEDVLTAKEIYDDFKASDDDDISKEVKRGANRKRIIKILRTNIKFCNDFMEQYQPYVDGKQIKIRSCLVGWTKKPEEE